MLLLLREDTIFRPPWLKIPSTAELWIPGHLKHGVLAETAYSVRRRYTARMADSHRRLHSTPCRDIWSAAVVCQSYLTWPGGWQEA